MRLRFWRRQRDHIVTKPSGLLVGDHLIASGIPANVMPPPGWTWSDYIGWYKIVGPHEPEIYLFRRAGR